MTVPSGIELPEEIQAELAQMDLPQGRQNAAPEGNKPAVGQTAGDTNGTQKADDPVAQALLSRLEGLESLIRAGDASNRTLQGQVRSLESRLVQTNAAPPKADFPAKQLADKLADGDANPLVEIVRQQQEQINAMASVIQGSQATTVNDAARQSWLEFMAGFSQDIGLDFAEIEKQVRHIPTANLAVHGFKLIAGEAKKNRVSPAERDTIRKEGARELAEKLGLYKDGRFIGSVNSEAALAEAQKKIARFEENPSAEEYDEIASLQL